MSNLPEETSNRMKPNVKRKWVAALRSGKYKPGRENLYDFKTDSYCCLGVLAAVCGVDPLSMNRRAILDQIHQANLLCPWNKASSTDDYDKDDSSTLRNPQRKLAAMNDKGKSFRQIAAYIERYL